jgi:hypothetical protein
MQHSTARSDTNASVNARTGVIAGALVLVMVLLTILDGLLTLPDATRWLAAVTAWSAGVLLMPRASLLLRVQVGVLLAVGIGLIIHAARHGARFDGLQAVSANTGLLTMIAAVGFLRLVALPAAGEIRRLPTGRRAFLQTVASVGIFASVINISAPILIADRIHRERPLDRFTTRSIIRVFTAMSNWSPLFAAMAAVLTYVEGARLDLIVIACLPFSILCVLVVVAEARWRHGAEVKTFVGYPLEKESLLLPLLLMFGVALSTRAFPQIPILVVIAICALGLTTAFLLARSGPTPALASLKHHVTQNLPQMVGELSLFLAAGVFAAGVAAIIETGIVESPFTRFDGVTAIELLGLMLLAAIIGIHPIILVSSLTPMLMTLNPNPTLLAIVYLTAWNLGTQSSYLSGTNLVFQGRYGIPSWRSAIWNWPFVAVMFVVAAGWLLLLSACFP